jgi:peptidoglycan/LPS O-acetylase OafA/YrhL
MLFARWRRAGAVFDPRRQNSFDLLRFVAASLVLVDHSFILTERHGPPGPFSYETLGGFAVAVFFVISGFLVAGSWQRDPRLAAFSAKRALRIVPAYVAVTALCALALGPMLTTLGAGDYFRHSQTWSYFGNITFMRLQYSLPGVFAGNPFPHAVNGSIWTLPIEILMYLVLAALGRGGRMTRTGVTALAAALALGWFGWGPALLVAPPLFLNALPATYTVHLALWFFLGSAFWVWRERIRYRADVVAVLLALLWGTHGTPFGTILFHGALPYLVLFVAQVDVRWMTRFGRYGDFSYGMYLYAFPTQQALTLAGGARWSHSAYLMASFGVTLLLAVASWHAVERPALRLKWRGGGVGPGGPRDAALMRRKVAASEGP